MTRTDRIKNEYSNPNSREYNGQSTRENIKKYAERAHTLSDGYKHRAQSGEIELPSGSERASYPGSAKSGEDARRIAKAELNHDVKATDYMPKVRRQA
jgi:hypothetical protein